MKTFVFFLSLFALSGAAMAGDKALPRQVQKSKNSKENKAAEKVLGNFFTARKNAKTVSDLRPFFADSFLTKRGEPYLQFLLKNKPVGAVKIEPAVSANGRFFIEACMIKEKSKKCEGVAEIWVMQSGKDTDLQIVDVYESGLEN